MQKNEDNFMDKYDTSQDREAVDHTVFRRAGFWDLFLPFPERKTNTNRYMFYTCILIVAFFFGMIAYMVHFMIMDRQNVIASPYNLRTENLRENVTRGRILSKDGKVLAETSIDKEGNEKRVYPCGELFSHVVGYAIHGKSGLEASCNYYLLASHADLLTQIENGVTSHKNPGDDIVTTLDSNLQQVAYDALGDYDGAILAIEPKTGKIRAMVSKPVYDPNTLEEMWNNLVNDNTSSVLLNRCTQGLYPPGSTYKSIVAWEYLREKTEEDPPFSYKCEGETVVDSVRIHCYEGNAHGEENLREAFAQSCNTAFVSIGSKLDRKKFIEFNQELLFNSTISCDVATAKSSFQITTESPKSSLPQTMIGQGDTLITPLHNALIMCTIANDGVMMRPTLLEEIKSYDDVSIKKFEPRSILEMEDDSNIVKIQQMLEKVVEDGTGTVLKNDQYTVAGKTGSAENEKEKAHSWFVGFSNVEDPDLVVCVIAENSGTGSKVAAPMAKKIFDAYYHED